MKKRIKIAVGIIGVIFINLFVLCLTGIKAEAAKEKARHIHIVFDNSTSMVKDKNQDMANATYALQVLLAMLGENDTAVIYRVSDYQNALGGAEISNSKCSDTELIDNTVSPKDVVEKKLNVAGARNTFFTTVMTAIEELKYDADDEEKWLVVLSDGKYEDWDPENYVEIVEDDIVDSVMATFMDEKYQDINIIHYSFQENIFYKKQQKILRGEVRELKSKITGKVQISDVHKDNLEKNVTFYPQESSGIDRGVEMLEIMIEIGNQIFNRQMLKYVRDEEGCSFEIEFPVKEIMIFYQYKNNGEGKNVDISDIEVDFPYADRKSVNVNTINELKINGYEADAIYSGSIITYNELGNKGILEEGTYNIQFEDSKINTLKIYYEPAIDVGVVLENQKNGQIYEVLRGMDNIKIPSGNYAIVPKLFHPVTGEKIKEQLSICEGTDYVTHIVNTENAINETVDSGNWEGKLNEGSYQISVIANIFTGLSIDTEVLIEVVESFENLEATIESPKMGINFEKENEMGNSLSLKILNDGKPLADEYKDNIEISLLDEENSYYKFNVKESSDGWILWPIKNQTNHGVDQRPNGWKMVRLQISLVENGEEIKSIETEKKVFYYGNLFVINFEASWGDKIDFWDYLLGRIGNYFPIYFLTIEPMISGEEVNWEEIDARNLNPEISGDEKSLFQIYISEDRTGWNVVPQMSLMELVTSHSLRTGMQEIIVDAQMTRYEQTNRGEKAIAIGMDVSLAEIIIYIIIVVVLIYLFINAMIKKMKRYGMNGVKGYVEILRTRKIILPIKISKRILFNLFMPGRNSFRVYLNEIKGGRNKKIVFVCKQGGICSVANMRECLAFSKIRINGLPLQEESLYDLEKGLRIVVEKDPDKIIVVSKK